MAHCLSGDDQGTNGTKPFSHFPKELPRAWGPSPAIVSPEMGYVLSRFFPRFFPSYCSSISSFFLSTNVTNVSHFAHLHRMTPVECFGLFFLTFQKKYGLSSALGVSNWTASFPRINPILYGISESAGYFIRHTVDRWKNCTKKVATSRKWKRKQVLNSSALQLIRMKRAFRRT